MTPIFINVYGSFFLLWRSDEGQFLMCRPTLYAAHFSPDKDRFPGRFLIIRTIPHYVYAMFFFDEDHVCVCTPQIIERLRTPVRQTFSHGIRHVFIMIH